MKRVVRILQISDLHKDDPAFADVWTGLVDDRHRNLSLAALDRATIQPARRALLSISQIVTELPPDLVLFQGDLGFRGRSATMIEGAKYISNILRECGIDGARARGLIGNHDVRRTETDRFNDIVDVWDRELSVAITTTMSSEELLFDTALIHLCSANSCQEAGTVDRLPMVIQPRIRELLDEHYAAGGGTEIEDELFLPIDIAGISSEQIDEHLIGRDFGSPTNGLVVVQAHHSILPQKIPKLAFCPELIQAGDIREALLEKTRPILYLHGHTHHPSHHIIQNDPETPNAKIICVGCKHFPVGFNLIDIEFEDEAPLSIQIKAYAQNPLGSPFGLVDDVVIPLVSGAERARHLSELERAILSLLVKRGTADPERVGNFVTQAGYDFADVVAAIRVLEQRAFATVINPDDPEENWVVKWRA